VFRNEDSGFTVVEIRDEAKNELVTAVGLFPFANQGERVRLTGEWTTHPEYGQQLKMETYIPVAPASTVGMENYLASGLIKGVGAHTARKLVEHFGMDVLDIIQFNPERLTEVDGIGKTRAEMIASSFSEQKEIREVMLFLQSYGITTTFALKIFKLYGDKTIELIRENPYRIADEVVGVGFKTADNIARLMGIEKDSPYRAAAGTRYVLSKSAGDGHTYLPKDELIQQACRLLEVDRTLVENALINLALSKSVFLEEIDGDVAAFLAPFYVAEKGAAKSLRDLSVAEITNPITDIEDKLKRSQERKGICLAGRQREAVLEAMKNGVVVITGGPGTGKTTTVNIIIDLFLQEGMEVELAAPTGRAAKRLSEATGREAKTIHRLLEYGYSDELGDGFHKDADNPIKADAVIIDEMSMVDILLLNNLLKAILPGTRLIMVGDVDQLPSVGPGNVLHDIIQSGVVHVVKLNEIFRQARESMIIVNAHRINNGELPLMNAKEKDFFLVRRSNTQETLHTLLDLISRRLPNFNDYHPCRDIQILAPMRKGLVGVNQLNHELQAVLNPPSPVKKEKAYRETLFRLGDKIMQIKNNYQLPWEKPGEDGETEKGEGVFNGDMGFVQDIDNEEQTLTVMFDDDRTVIYDFTQLDELELAYAISIHKSQGSEFPVVIIPLVHGPPMLMTRNLLYTAVTRAKELVVIVGREKVIAEMVANNHIAKRYSNLSKRLRQAAMGMFVH
jgi:exodeoxyribonuclease V alpha subunit